MTHRSAAWLAWSLPGLFAGSQVLTVWLIWYGPAAPDVAFGILMFGFGTVGALMASRRPRNAVGWLTLAIAMAFVVQVLGDVYAQSSSYPAHTQVDLAAVRDDLRTAVRETVQPSQLSLRLRQ
jgi:hypothetical protein